ncbi:MAG: hypothetical protein M1831_002627 [Alyxoria varia]|nr:MAG: hypothetical protein M1831_002627 [Alyxoria varia]
MSDTPGAGQEVAPIKVSWLKRDVLLFAASIGCTVDELHFLYELHPNFQPFPTYPIILPFKHTDQEVIDFIARAAASAPPQIQGLPKLDPRRVVDGQRSMTFLKPLPPSSSSNPSEPGPFEIRSKILGVYDKGKPGTVIDTEYLLVDSRTGDVYTRIVGSGFFVGQGGWGGPKGEKSPDYSPPRGKGPDATSSIQTTPETAHLYRLNGDYNPLHATPEPGAKMGFGGAILHGLYSWNASAVIVLRTFGESNPKNMQSFEARFASPVKPGDKLVVDMWRMGKGSGEGDFDEIRFQVKIDGGKVCLSNGRALVRCVDSKSKL